MARTHAKDADFLFDAVQLEDELAEIRLRFDVPEADITSFSDAWQNFLAGKPTLTMDISGALDPAAGAGDITIFGELGLQAEEYDYDFDTGTTGYDGVAIVTSYEIISNRDDAIRYRATFRHAGSASDSENDGGAPTRTA